MSNKYNHVCASAFQGNPCQLRTGSRTEKWMGKDI